MTSTMPMLALAMPDALAQAVERRLSVFPLNFDKKPFNGMSWKAFQTTPAGRTQIETWHRMRPPLWAVVTGAVSRLIILDFDGVDGVLLMQMNRIRPHLQTPSGGHHAWFWHPGWPVPTLNSKADKAGLGALYPGLDIRADGGYAGFCGRSSSGEYRWVRPMEPDPLDVLPVRLRAVLGLLDPPKPKAKSHGGANPAGRSHQVPGDLLTQRALALAPGLGRNNAGFWLACQARDNGFPESDHQLMLDYQRACPATNLKGDIESFTEHEALACWKQAFSRAAREPWTGGRQ